MVDHVKEIKEAHAKLTSLMAERNVLKDQLAKKHESIEETTINVGNLEKGRAIVQIVASNIQQDLEFRLTNIVTVALASVFDDPYEFKVEFVTRRNQTECDMLFVKNGNECDPMESSGGGALDIASLALRMAVWSIKKTRAIQILDEPAKYLSRDMQDKCSEMIKELSAKLGIQMIIVSHIPEMINAADRVFQLEQKDGLAKIRVIG